MTVQGVRLTSGVAFDAEFFWTIFY